MLYPLISLKNFLSLLILRTRIAAQIDFGRWRRSLSGSFKYRTVLICYYLLLPVQKSSSLVQVEMGPKLDKFHPCTTRSNSSPALFGNSQKVITQYPPSLTGTVTPLGVSTGSDNVLCPVSMPRISL